MKKIKMAKAVGLADEKYIAEAAPKANTKGIFWRKFALIAACISLVVTSACLWLFLPYERADIGTGEIDRSNLPRALEEYADSEYLDLMYAIYKYDKAHYSRPNNNFENYVEDILDDIFGFFAPKSDSAYNADAMAPGASSPFYNSSSALEDGVIEEAVNSSVKGDGEYVETTDNQVAGVIEADLFKRTTTHIFYLNLKDMSIRAYSIAGEESGLVSVYSLNTEGRTFADLSAQIFLSQDGKTLTVLGNNTDIVSYSTNGKGATTRAAVNLISLDVSDPANIKEKASFAITGSLLSARLVDGKILLMSKFNTLGFDYSEDFNFIPQIDKGDGFEFIPAEDIIFPEELTSKFYTVVTQLNESDLSFEGAIACLSYSTEVYVSADKVFLTRGYSDYIKGTEDGVDFVKNANVTDILALGYGSGSFEKLGRITVEGSVKDQYSLDEYEGILRVVTTTRGTKYSGGVIEIEDGGITATDSVVTSFASNAALYCIDLETWQIVGEVRDFAPSGETVESVRFDGTNAYVCTAVVVTFTDPVYFFDLSDMSNITYTDTGVIEGYSSSLVNFGDGLLLGIGYGDSRDTLKIEVYAENGDKVESIASYEQDTVLFSEDYKSYFIDRDRGLIGIGFADRSNGNYENKYVLLCFNGYELVEVMKVDIDSYVDVSVFRATLADGYFYVMAYEEFKAVKIFN